MFSTNAGMDVRIWSTHDEVLLLCRGNMLICTRAKKQGGRRVSWTLAGHAHRKQRLLHRLEPATLVGMRWQDCDVKQGDIETNMDAISNLHQRRRPTEKTPRHHRQRLHAYTNNISDVRTTMDVISNGAYGLRQRCRRIKEANPDAIHNGSKSTSKTLSHRKDRVWTVVFFTF